MSNLASMGTGHPSKEARTKGNSTRWTILAHAVDMASAEGLDGLTIGRLAAEMHMSKSGLFAHFGSKTDLQCATVDAASIIFAREVIRPARDAPRGIWRLWTLVDAWLSHVERRVFRGGCFFAAAAAEFDSKPGPTRERIAAASRQWLDAIAEAAKQARTRGHLTRDADPKQIAFEANGCLLAANWARELLEDEDAFARARSALRAQLDRVATSEGRQLLKEITDVSLPVRYARTPQ